MQYNKQFKTVLFLLLSSYSCQKPCNDKTTNIRLVDQKKQEIAYYTGNICETDALLDYHINSNDYIVRTYFHNKPKAIDDFKSSGDILFDHFESGVEILGTGAQLDENSLQNHYFEIIRKSDLAHNINQPKLIDVSKTDSENINAKIELTGIALQLMLSFENKEAIINNSDIGGAKMWIYKNTVKLDGSEYTESELIEYQCVLDNTITFMKGNRLKYQPSIWCKDEEERLAEHSDLLNRKYIYGKYKVEKAAEGYDNLGTKYLIILDFEVEKQIVKVLEADWNEIVILTEKKLADDSLEYSKTTLAPAQKNTYPNSL